MSQEVIEQVFNVTGRARLVVANVRGSVVVRAGEPGVITVKAVKHNDSGSRTEVRVVQDADGTVRAEARYNDASFSFLSFSKPCKVEFTIDTPPEVDLTVSAVSSAIDVTGLNGNFDLHTVSGELQLAELSGSLKINTVSGDISAVRLAGTLTLESVSGDVRLGESSLGTANVRSVSGDVLLQTPLGEGPYQFNTVSGDVRLVTQPGTPCTAEINTVSGKIASSFAQTSSRGSGRSQTIDIYGGGVRIALKSVSGDLMIGDTVEPIAPAAPPPPPAPEPPTPPETPAPPMPSLTTAEILEKIERGEMSVEEGLKLIQGG
jgi:DUF4097 and DUF4098 domain-containing protein YvlB